MKKCGSLPMKDTKLIFPRTDHHPIVRSPLKSHFRATLVGYVNKQVSFGFCPVKIHATIIDDVQEIRRVKKRRRPEGLKKKTRCILSPNFPQVRSSRPDIIGGDLGEEQGRNKSIFFLHAKERKGFDTSYHNNENVSRLRACCQKRNK